MQHFPRSKELHMQVIKFLSGAVMIFVIVLAVAVLLSGCSVVSETGNDAKKGTRETGPADIQNFPNGFNNVAHKCDGDNMVYVTNNAGSQSGKETGGSGGVVAVVKDDPRCTTK